MRTHSAVQSRFDYDPFGKATISGNNIVPSFLYAGYYFHAPSELYLTPFRAYDKNAGRWLSRDPVGEFGIQRSPMWSLNQGKYEILATNLYTYSGNNSMEFTDPMGLDYGVRMTDSEGNANNNGRTWAVSRTDNTGQLQGGNPSVVYGQSGNGSGALADPVTKAQIDNNGNIIMPPPPGQGTQPQAGQATQSPAGQKIVVPLPDPGKAQYLIDLINWQNSPLGALGWLKPDPNDPKYKSKSQPQCNRP